MHLLPALVCGTMARMRRSNKGQQHEDGQVMDAPRSWKRGIGSARLRWLWLLLLFAVVVLYPTLRENTGAKAYDSGTVHIYRGLVFSKAISDGVILPRWTQFLHLGLGSPVFSFYGPLSYYGMDLLYRIGIPHPVGWRILIAGALLLGFLGTYLLVYTLTRRKWPSLLAAVVFLFAPYVLRNTLERGSPEAFSMVLYPWVIWSLLWLAQRPSGLRFLLASAIWAACIASHILAPLMLAPFALVVGLLLAWKYRTATPVLALLAGGLLVAFIWVPLLTEPGSVHVERDFSQEYANPVQISIPLDRLLELPAVFDVQRDNNGTGDRIGLLNLLFLVIGVPGTVLAWRKGDRQLAVALGLATFVGLFLFWMLTSASDPFWNLFGAVLRRLQFRSRLMGVQALAMAVAAGILVALVANRWRRTVALGLALVLVLTALPSLYTNLFHLYGAFGNDLTLPEVRAAEIRSGGSAFTSFGEFTPRWREAPFDDQLLAELGPDFDPQVSPLHDQPPTVQVRSSQVRSTAWDLAIEATQPTTLTLNVLYYPQWQAFLDGQQVPLNPQPITGYVQTQAPSGDHDLALRYSRSTAERIGLVMSGLTAVALLAVGARDILRRRSGQSSPTAVDSSRAGVVSPSRAEVEIAPSWWLLLLFTVLIGSKWLYVDPSTTWLRCVSTPERVCGAESAVDVQFTGGPSLRGYTVPSQTVRPGEDFRVVLFWQADEKPADNLYGFVHIRSSQKDWPVNPSTGSEIWAQQDNFAPGNLSTTDFVPGKLYRDEYRVPIPEDIPPGPYYLEVGWQNPATGEQLEPVPDSVTPPLDILWRSILLPSVTVE